MKCNNCGETVLKVDTVCKKCGHTLIATEVSEAVGTETRSRATLFFKAWIGGIKGSHYRWLHFDDKAEKAKEKYKGGAWQMVLACFTLNPVAIFTSFFKLIAMGIFYSIEIIGILCGKYRTDAYGNPIRWKTKK